MAGRFPEASKTSHFFWIILLFRFGVLEGRVAETGIDADMIARSNSSLRDSRDDPLHTEVEASDINWLSFALGLLQEHTSCFCFRIRQMYQACSPSENWDHANIQVDEQDMHFSFP